MTKQFEEWHRLNYPDFYNDKYKVYLQWNNMPFSMKWGVYLQFFDSKKIDVTVFYNENKNTQRFKACVFYLPNPHHAMGAHFDTRIEAQKAAVEEAFETLKKYAE